MIGRGVDALDSSVQGILYRLHRQKGLHPLALIFGVGERITDLRHRCGFPPIKRCFGVLLRIETIRPLVLDEVDDPPRDVMFDGPPLEKTHGAIVARIGEVTLEK